MLHEFQIVYRQPGWPLQVVTVQVDAFAKRAERAAMDLLKDSGVEIIKATRLRTVLPPGQEWLSRDEAAAYCGCDASVIDRAQADGELPRSKEGAPRWRRQWLDAWMSKRMAISAELMAA